MTATGSAPASPATVKCLIWDLDNTLWQGTLAEGDTVALTPGVRDLIVELDSRGILQAVASKNDHDVAWARLDELGIAEYLILPQIHWGPKSQSVRDIADRLNFAHHAVAFVDDQPYERAEVAHHLPDVRLYPATALAGLVDLPEFVPSSTTVDSRRRREMYKAGFDRDEARADFGGSDEEFLRSLALEMDIAVATDQEITRVEELTLRTSQMNATGVHYSDGTLRGLLDDPDHEVLVVTLDDRFGSHGAVGVLLLERHPAVWHLKLLATSCRVVSFGAGAVILRWLIDEAAGAGVHLVADFRSTDRNRMMEVAYRFAGFAEASCGCDAGLAAAPEPDIARWHLEPSPQLPSTTISLTAPTLRTSGGCARQKNT